MIDIEALELSQPVTDIDEMLLELGLKHKLPPLLLSAIMMARLMHLNDECETTEDFVGLLESISNGYKNKEFTVPDKGSLH
jgi:hypothetical protein